MSVLTRRLNPEEEEMIRQGDELAAIRETLAAREMELVDVCAQLCAFEGRYLRKMGSLYAELDEWRAGILELRYRRDCPDTTKERIEEAREQSHQTHQEAHGIVAESDDFAPSPELRTLFLEVAKRIHPDFSKDDVDQERRTRMMAAANCAYRAGNAEVLQGILDEYQFGADAVEGGGIGARLIRLIRQISEAKDRLLAIERELANQHQSEVAQLKHETEEKQRQGRDLLAELAATVRGQIELARKEHDCLCQQEGRRV